MSARIIPFPQRSAEPTDPEPAERLARALKGLEDALAEQRQAVASWRAALGTLQDTVESLGDGLRRYRGSLDGLHAKVTALNAEAGRLERWANGALSPR
jgi:ABC-type transporter Mla subunit MlaD